MRRGPGGSLPEYNDVPGPPHSWGGENHDAQGMSDRSLALAEVSPTRPVLGARVWTADGAALAVGLVLLLTDSDGDHADRARLGPDRHR